jgi:uncharacterized Zn ribbon protein
MRGHLMKLCQSGVEIRIGQGIRELAIVGHSGIVDCRVDSVKNHTFFVLILTSDCPIK